MNIYNSLITLKYDWDVIENLKKIGEGRKRIKKCDIFPTNVKVKNHRFLIKRLLCKITKDNQFCFKYSWY